MQARSALALTVGFAAEAVRESGPLVHCVAPRAATPFVAEVLHGVGARAVVTGTSADALAASLTADAVFLDFATLSSEWSDTIVPTVGGLRQAALPWVLDLSPLGRAAVRVDRARALLGNHPTVVRSTEPHPDGLAADPAAALMIGEWVEEVRLGARTTPVPAGADLLGQVPGVRSAVCALVAACATVTGPAEAALAGAAWFALASERAAADSHGPASFRIALVDALAVVRGDEIAEYLPLG